MVVYLVASTKGQTFSVRQKGQQDLLSTAHLNLLLLLQENTKANKTLSPWPFPDNSIKLSTLVEMGKTL